MGRKRDIVLHGTGKTAALVQRMTERIVAGFDPVQVILFGSYARGDAKAGSDVDLLVVLPEVADKHQKSVEISRALADVPLAKDVIVTTPQEMARRGALVGPILRPALKEGKVLFERPDCHLEVGVAEPERLNETHAWLSYASDDLSFAEAAAADPHRPPRYVCFLAQQSAEKALKAILVYEQIEYPRTHNVGELLELLPDTWAVVRDSLPDLRTLSSWAVQARYPDSLRDATPAEAQSALEQARAVWASVSGEFTSRGIAA
jgi:HEPN domain-containing protein/predicted nucleotidyltransferase